MWAEGVWVGLVRYSLGLGEMLPKYVTEPVVYGLARGCSAQCEGARSSNHFVGQLGQVDNNRLVGAGAGAGHVYNCCCQRLVVEHDFERSKLYWALEVTAVAGEWEPQRRYSRASNYAVLGSNFGTDYCSVEPSCHCQ